MYLIHTAFFSALWAGPFRTGRSVVVICLGLLALLLLAATAVRALRRDLLSGCAPIAVRAGS